LEILIIAGSRAKFLDVDFGIQNFVLKQALTLIQGKYSNSVGIPLFGINIRWQKYIFFEDRKNM
jgi:hypothetical protein